MKFQIRSNVFETNSSSTHSMIICSTEEYEKWQKGKMLFDKYNETFIAQDIISEEDKKNTESFYNKNKTDYWKDWKDLTKAQKENWYQKYMTNILGKEYPNALTFEDFINSSSAEFYSESMITPKGERIIIFGHFGYDG